MTLDDAKSGGEKEKKEKILEIFQNFKPVFRFFFLEKFGDPSTWMNNRLMYAHSVSVTSIVGYILGDSYWIFPVYFGLSAFFTIIFVLLSCLI